MNSKIRWGILGLGGIAEVFANALSDSKNGELVAVGSRSQEKADQFGKKFGAAHCHGSYQALADDKDVDIIYVCTPHNFHRENTILCLEAGKHVLCEKPFAVTAAEAKAMIDCARAKKLFLMEAMWTRFVPTMDKVRKLIATNEIGEIRMLATDFGFCPANGVGMQRLLDPALAGGALLDVGIYPLALSSMLFGRPRQIQSAAYIGNTGVDEQAAILLSFDGGRLATLYAAVQTETPREATIMGTKAIIRLHRPWWKGGNMTIIRRGKPDQFIEVPSHENGFVYEIEAAHESLRKGLLENDLMGLDESLAIMETMDTIRKQCGLKYPFE